MRAAVPTSSRAHDSKARRARGVQARGRQGSADCSAARAGCKARGLQGRAARELQGWAACGLQGVQAAEQGGAASRLQGRAAHGLQGSRAAGQGGALAAGQGSERAAGQSGARAAGQGSVRAARQGGARGAGQGSERAAGQGRHAGYRAGQVLAPEPSHCALHAAANQSLLSAIKKSPPHPADVASSHATILDPPRPLAAAFFSPVMGGTHACDSRDVAGNADTAGGGGRENAADGNDCPGSSGDGEITDRSGGGGSGGRVGGSGGYQGAARIGGSNGVQLRAFEESTAATCGGEVAARPADCDERRYHEQNGFWQPSVSAKRKRPFRYDDDDSAERRSFEAASTSGLTWSPQTSFYYESLAGLSDPSCRDHRATMCLAGDWSTSRWPPVDLTESGNATAQGGGRQDRQPFCDPHNRNHPQEQLHPQSHPQHAPIAGLSGHPAAEGARATARGAAECARAGRTAREPASAGGTGGTGGWRGGIAEENRIVVGAPALLASATTGGDRLGGVMRGVVTAPPQQTAHAQTQECAAAAAETPHTSQEQERVPELLRSQSPAGGTSGQPHIAADATGGACTDTAMAAGAATGAGGSLRPPSILPPSMVALPATALLPLPWQHLLPHRPSTHVLLPLPSPPHIPALPQPLPLMPQPPILSQPQLLSQPRLLISQPQLSSQPQLLIAQPESSSQPPLQSPLPFQSSPLVPAPWPAIAPPPTHGVGLSTVAPHPLPANSSAIAATAAPATTASVTAAAAGGGRHGVGGGKGEGMVGDDGYGQGQGHHGDDDVTNQRKQRRMHSNRQSAKRSRLRRQQLLEKLEMDAAKLRVEHSALCRREAEATERAAELQQQQVKLQQERDAVLARVKERGSGRQLQEQGLWVH
ncbi:unnamed protein product [Closterium sp. NIES-64]|nr:unnamed protein product [Closterium sp. NIES-64]